MKSQKKNVVTKKNIMLNILKILSANLLKLGRALVNIKLTKFSNIKLLDKNKNLISNSNKIANIFNNHFSTIGSKIEQGIPFHPGNFKDYLNKKDKNGKLFVNSTNISFFFSPTIPKEVEKIIDAPDVKKVNMT